MSEEQPEEVAAVQHELQQIVLSLTRTHRDEPVDKVREVLSGAIEAAGIPQQPAKWVTDAAADISAGRLLVMNAHEERLMGNPGERVDPVDPETDRTS